MKDLRQRIEADENWFEHLVRNIPGFDGYKERDNRRTADQILRKQLATELDQQAKKLNALRLSLTNAGKLEHLDDVDRFGRKLAAFIDSVRYADYGYTGFFDAIKIKEEDLDRLYEHDSAIFDRITELASAIDSLVAAEDGALLTQVTAAAKKVEELNAQWREREKVMQGLKEEGVA